MVPRDFCVMDYIGARRCSVVRRRRHGKGSLQTGSIECVLTIRCYKMKGGLSVGCRSTSLCLVETKARKGKVRITTGQNEMGLLAFKLCSFSALRVPFHPRVKPIQDELDGKPPSYFITKPRRGFPPGGSHMVAYPSPSHLLCMLGKFVECKYVHTPSSLLMRKTKNKKKNSLSFAFLSSLTLARKGGVPPQNKTPHTKSFPSSKRRQMPRPTKPMQ